MAHCFEWFGRKWGGEFNPGWASFRAALLARGVDPNDWVDAHPAAAKCIGAKPDTPPIAAPLK